MWVKSDHISRWLSAVAPDVNRRWVSGCSQWHPVGVGKFSQVVADDVQRPFALRSDDPSEPEMPLVQRCTLHKRRNVGDHLPKKGTATGSMPDSVQRLVTRTPTLGFSKRNVSPPNWSGPIPTLRDRCVKDSMTCSPFAVSESTARWCAPT